MKKETIKNAANPKWGLFEVSFWKHPIIWLKDLHIYHERLRHLKKFGYSPQAKWETFFWFIDITRDLLNNYRYNRKGTGWYLEEYSNMSYEEVEQKNNDFYNAELDKMIELLDKMDERINPVENAEDYSKMFRACEEFFEMFSKYFYGFWD